MTTIKSIKNNLKQTISEKVIIELTFTNIYKTPSKGFIYILRTLYKKFLNTLWRFKVFAWPFRVSLWRYQSIIAHKFFTFQHKIYLSRHNVNMKINDLVINLKKKMKIIGRLIDSNLKEMIIIIFNPSVLPKYILLFLLSFSLKALDLIFILIKMVSHIPNKTLALINSIFKFPLKTLAKLMYLFARDDFTPRAKECLSQPFICVNPFDQSMLPKKYKGRSTLIIADFLSLDFPDDFDMYRNSYLEGLFEKEARDSRNVVCFSKHVRDRHLVKGLGIDKNKIIIIPHTLHNLSSEYNTGAFDNKSMINKAILTIQNSKVFSRREKKRIIRSKYFLSASTYRKPYKGIKTLLLFNKIIKDKNRNFFTVSTHIPDEDKELFKEDGGIVPNNRVNNSELSALYVLSYASIHVSKFEGGINVAPFSEAVSVGRPCIFLSNLATQEANLNKIELGEIKDKNLKNKFTSNYDSIEKTFLYLVDNYQTVLDNQKKYYIDYYESHGDSDRNKLWEHALNDKN